MNLNLLTCVRASVVLHFTFFDVKTCQPSEFIIPLQLCHSFCWWKYSELSRCDKTSIWVMFTHKSLNLTLGQIEELRFHASWCKHLEYLKKNKKIQNSLSCWSIVSPRYYYKQPDCLGCILEYCTSSPLVENRTKDNKLVEIYDVLLNLYLSKKFINYYPYWKQEGWMMEQEWYLKSE